MTRQAPLRRFERLAAGFALLILARSFLVFFVPAKTGGGALLPGGSGAEAALQAAGYLVALTLAFRFAPGVRRVFLRDLWPLGFTAFALASTLWSVAPSSSLGAGVQLLVATLFGGYLAARYPPRELIALIAHTFLFAALASAATALLLPAVGVAIGSHEGSWQGIYDHKNTLGMRMVLALVALGILFSVRRRTWIVVAIVAVATVLWFSDSKTSIAVAGALLVAVPLVRAVGSDVRALAIALTAFTLVAIAGLAVVTETGDPLLERVNPRGTLLGRSRLWNATIEEVAQRPLLGYGLDAFWQEGRGEDAAIRRDFPWGPAHAHNGFLEAALQLGLLGVGAIVLHLGIFVIRAVRAGLRNRGTVVPWAVAFLLCYLLLNATYSNLAGQSTIFWTLYVAVSLQLSRRSLLFPAPETARAGANHEPAPRGSPA